MSEYEATRIYFSLMDGLDEAELKELNAAYTPIEKEIIHRELQTANENHMMTSYWAPTGWPSGSWSIIQDNIAGLWAEKAV